MRPTLLHFRHPREQTAEYVVPSVTYDGRRLQFSPSFTNKTGSHWGRASRFNNELSRRNVLGPGAYNHQDSPLFKKLNGPRFALDSSFGAPRDSYMYVGDTLVNLRPTERSVACSRRGQSRDMDRSYDAHHHQFVLEQRTLLGHQEKVSSPASEQQIHLEVKHPSLEDASIGVLVLPILH
eukprot:TRINITY_DN4268_c0_g1_i3.p1 TRINITY_DN4268_c0_g1~~TRINITY_DN4268_c0_g1_i3.p1  ORF type:complete len:180 (-),score=10.49 TRINITY_DN4268_c0_g1_i3:768-1307(-)